ncbi:MAG: CRISPR-associated DxTHG motif protein [Cyanobacteria bacterium SIG27]|nr:CRISPR-associated DxTHG motif protein [Cyanobacteria bacterium SIG27]
MVIFIDNSHSINSLPAI